MACAFQAAALQAVARGVQQPSARLAALTSFNEMFLSTAFGQFLDVQIPVDEEAYWRTTQAKSSPFFGAVLQVGALAGGATLEIAEQLKALGHLYGEMIQIHDDMHDSMEVPANPDWVQKRKPLPILFAQTVDHPSRSRFVDLCDDVSNPKSLEEAQEILIRCGAFSYCVDQLLSRYQTVRGMLSTIAIERPSVLGALFEGVVAPVWKLFKATADAPFEISISEVMLDLL
jgi:geranylgeranyl pyrophosphate synthase